MFAIFSLASSSVVSSALPRRALLTRATACTTMLLSGTSYVRADGEVLPKTGGIMKFCDEDTMAPKAHGTSMSPVQSNLRWNVDEKTAGQAPGLALRPLLAHPALLLSLDLSCPGLCRSHLQLQSALCRVRRILGDDEIFEGGRPR